jgi:Carboxypeptidase regulatory-like domain
VTSRESPPGPTAWLKTGGGPTAVFSDVVLDRIKFVEGVVHDRDAKPIMGAIVFQSGDGPIRTRTVTDAQGRFRVSGVLAGKAILFVRKDGFRFHGQTIDTEAGAFDLVLIRLDETPTALKTLESAVPHQEELALARRLLAPYLEKVLAGGTDPQKFQTVAVLAQIDPGRALELIESQGAGKPRDALDSLRGMVATALASQSPDEAVTIAESIQSSGLRSWCLTDLVDKLPASARDRKTGLLAQALLRARGVKQPGERIRLLGRVAERSLELGEKDRAAVLFAEARALAKEVAPPAYEVPMFAQSLASLDLTGALALVESSKDLARRGDRVNRVFIFDRAYGEIAYRVAASDPAGAERVLNLIVDPHRRGGYVVAACARMASKDLARARRLAVSIEEPAIRAYALGRMALASAAVDTPRAVGLLEEAFTQLEQHRDDRKGYSSPACVASVLLQSVEAVDPVRLQESDWRAIALRSPLIDERGDGSSGRADAELAMNLARYDRTAARAVLARAIDSYRTTGADTARQGFVAMALAVIDPVRVVSLVESLPEEPSLERTLPKNFARLLAAELLAKPGEERWKATRGHGVSLWTPEGSDL